MSDSKLLDFGKDLLSKFGSYLINLIIPLIVTLLLTALAFIERVDPLIILVCSVGILAILVFLMIRVSDFFERRRARQFAFMSLVFDPNSHVQRDPSGVRFFRILIRNDSKVKTIQKAVLKLNYLKPLSRHERAEPFASQFREVAIQPERLSLEGMKGIDIRPGDQESYILLRANVPHGEFYVHGYSPQVNEPTPFMTPSADYELSVTATAENSAPYSVIGILRLPGENQTDVELTVSRAK